MRRSAFREQGLRHQLLVLSDLSRELREEEREAWKRLVRVLGHELNNSLTPIKSIAGSLESLLVREPRPLDWHDDMQRGLSIIGSRSESLSRFMQAYAHLARLPPRVRVRPNRRARAARCGIRDAPAGEIIPGSEFIIEADGDQLDNCSSTYNATPSTRQCRGAAASRSLDQEHESFTLIIEDKGAVCPTRQTSSSPSSRRNRGGRALVWSQPPIAEAHVGTLTLMNRRRAQAVRRDFTLPLLSQSVQVNTH